MTDTEAVHFHLWLRSGKSFHLVDRRYNTKAAAFKAGKLRRADPQDRMVLQCRECPRSQPSRKRPSRWGHMAREVRQLPPNEINAKTLQAIYDADRNRAASKPAQTGSESAG